MNLMAVMVLLSLQAQADQQLLNDDWTIAPGHTQTFTVTLEGPATVQIDIRGVKYADKGFRVTLSDGGTEVTRTLSRSSRWSAGSHVVKVKNSENILHRATVHIRITARAEPAAAHGPVPQKVGQCVKTTVLRVGTRFEGEPGSGTEIEFANGIGLVGYDTVAEAEEARPGDAVTLCLMTVPANCPAGDERGRIFSVANSRTKKKFSMQNSSHSCGGA